MDKILHTVDISASPDVVFEALTSQEGLANWWTTQVQTGVGDSDDEIQFRMVEGFNPRMQVTVSEPGHLIRWRCVDGVDDWADDSFEFRLEERDGATVLFFTQHYTEEVDDETYGRYNFNWGFYLQSLCTYCEKGRGLPFQPSE